MRTKSQVLIDLKYSTGHLLEVLSDVPEGFFNKEAEGEGWTIGQVAEHLIKVETGTLRLFSDATEATDRDPEQKIEEIKDRMLNYENKMKAFGSIIPDNKPKDKTKALEKLQDIRQKIAGLIDIKDLTKTISTFEHPVFGWLTRVEWVYFNIYHSERHLMQIEDIERSLDIH